jgi:ribose transport system substrate-binding protein
MTVSGLGPHGERAAPPERVTLLPEDRAAAKVRDFRVAVVLHTLESDWARQQLSGIVGILGDCGTAVTHVIDCGFSPDEQVRALDSLLADHPDAVISLPVANQEVALAHARLAEAGIRLVLLDNAPTGLLPGRHYGTLVSADNFGLGLIAAEGLSPHLPPGAEVGLLGYAADFFATNEREIAFTQWMQTRRPDVTIRQDAFGRIDEATARTRAMLAAHPGLSGLFVVWDTPALKAADVIRQHPHPVPIATVDLGEEVAIGLAQGGPFAVIAAQQPYLQGVAAAQTAILTLLGRLTPAWIALPGVAVTRANVVESFQRIWRSPAPQSVLKAVGLIR